MLVPTLEKWLRRCSSQMVSRDVQEVKMLQIGERGRQFAAQVVHFERQSGHDRALDVAIDEVALHAVPVALWS